MLPYMYKLLVIVNIDHRCTTRRRLCRYFGLLLALLLITEHRQYLLLGNQPWDLEPGIEDDRGANRLVRQVVTPLRDRQAAMRESSLDLDGGCYGNQYGERAIQSTQ